MIHFHMILEPGRLYTFGAIVARVQAIRVLKDVLSSIARMSSFAISRMSSFPLFDVVTSSNGTAATTPSLLGNSFRRKEVDGNFLTEEWFCLKCVLVPAVN